MELPTLYLDIETIPAGPKPESHYPKKPSLEDVKTGNRKGNNAVIYAQEKLPDLVSKWHEDCKSLDQKIDDEYRKRATNSLTCEVICIAYALSDAEPEVIRGTEQEIIQGFNALLNRYGVQKASLQVVGHNIFEFDLPIIFHRSIKYGQSSLMKYMIGFNDYQGRGNIYDTMQKWNLFSYKKYTKLDDIAKFLSIKGKGDIDGSMVYDMYLAGQIDQICEYCMDDVDMVRRVHKRMITL